MRNFTLYGFGMVLMVGCVPSALASSGGDCNPFWSNAIGQPGANNRVWSMQTHDDGFGEALFVSGDFTSIEGTSASRIAKWDGSAWSTLGSGLNGAAAAMVEFDDGSGPALYVGGFFTTAAGASANYIAKWDGISWTPVGTGMNAEVYALAVFDDGLGGGPALYAGGDFSTAGGVGANNIAKWDGTSWSPLGTGTGNVGASTATVQALAVFDDGLGGGPRLYAGGQFDSAGGVANTQRIAAWDGTLWLSVGGGIGSDGNYIADIEVFDDGIGGAPALYITGSFSEGGTMNRIAKWNGVSWSALGSGLNSWGYELHSYDDGTGPALYVGGDFTTAGGVSANKLARWDGAGWSTIGSAVNNWVLAFASFDDASGSGPALCMGGDFTVAGGASANRLALWQGCYSEGACCINEFAVSLTAAECAAVGGTFFGLGSDPATVDCPSECIADVDGNGVVDVVDLLIVLGAWGACPSG